MGIVTAVLSAIPVIPLSTGANRVVKGVRVEHVCGNPLLSSEDDFTLQLHIVQTALRALQTPVDGPTLFEPGEMSEAREVVHA